MVSRGNGLGLKVKQPLLHLLALKVFVHLIYTITCSVPKFSIVFGDRSDTYHLIGTISYVYYFFYYLSSCISYILFHSLFI